MKFRIDPWTGIYKHPGWLDVDVELLPGIAISINKYSFPPEERYPTERKGGNVCIVCSWLLWGITFQFLFGYDAEGKGSGKL